jgi:hypothetical protein
MYVWFLWTIDGEFALVQLQARVRGVITRQRRRVRFWSHDWWHSDRLATGRPKKGVSSGYQWCLQQQAQQQARGSEFTTTKWHAPPLPINVSFTMTQTEYYTDGLCRIVYAKQPTMPGKEWRINNQPSEARAHQKLLNQREQRKTM